MKAKKSLTNSFDHLLKRRGSRDDFNPMAREHSLPMNATLFKVVYSYCKSLDCNWLCTQLSLKSPLDSYSSHLYLAGK